MCEASSGQAALDIWDKQASEIALLLSDIVMPDGLTGRDLAEKLRAQRPGLQVIFMSGYSAEVIGKDTEFFHRTKSHFLHKPCSPSVLLRTVRQALDEKQAATPALPQRHIAPPRGWPPCQPLSDRQMP